MRVLAAWSLVLILVTGCKPPEVGGPAPAASDTAVRPAPTPTPPGPQPPASSAPSASSASSGPAPALPAGSKTLFVRERRADCEGEGPRKCLMVREQPSAPWTLFYSSIDGFTYEEGSAYELVVSVEPVPGAPADAPSLRYRLVRIVSKKPAP